MEIEVADPYQMWQLALGAWLKTQLVMKDSGSPRLPYEDLVLPPASDQKGEKLQVLRWVGEHIQTAHGRALVVVV